MKRNFTAAAIVVALVAVGLMKPTAQADSAPCDTLYELHTFELVEMTVDGEPQATLDEYEGREFFLHTNLSIHQHWMFLVAHERQEDRMSFLRPGEGEAQ